MVTPMYVEIADEPPDEVKRNSQLENFTLTYEAKTKLEHAKLTIIIPEELTGFGNDDTDRNVDESTDLMDIARRVAGTADDKRNRSAAGYVYATDRYSAPANLEVTGGNTITWYDLTMNAGQRFRTVIRVDISQTANEAGEINDDRCR